MNITNTFYLIAVILIIIGLVFYLSKFSSLEKFIGTRFNIPTRNMSYDLRGDAYKLKKEKFPFENSAIGPL
jgi:hypothetical protein